MAVPSLLSRSVTDKATAGLWLEVGLFAAAAFVPEGHGILAGDEITGSG
jgi:hypothetical protein